MSTNNSHPFYMLGELGTDSQGLQVALDFALERGARIEHRDEAWVRTTVTAHFQKTIRAWVYFWRSWATWRTRGTYDYEWRGANIPCDCYECQWADDHIHNRDPRRRCFLILRRITPSQPENQR